jgi:toxin-antitoxin system PIN domain toxin
MILIDVNLLVYAFSSSTIQHEAASIWLEAKLNGDYRVGLPWASITAFLRLMTNRRVLPVPISMDEALKQIDRWLSSEQAWIPEPTANHLPVFKKLLNLPGLQANDVPDAHLAALALEHGLTLCSSDRGFTRFPGLKWEDPLSS